MDCNRHARSFSETLRFWCDDSWCHHLYLIRIGVGKKKGRRETPLFYFRLPERPFAARAGLSKSMVDGTPESPVATSHLSSPLTSPRRSAGPSEAKPSIRSSWIARGALLSRSVPLRESL